MSSPSRVDFPGAERAADELQAHAAGGLEPYISTAAEFTALIRRDYEKYGKIVKEMKITVD